MVPATLLRDFLEADASTGWDLLRRRLKDRFAAPRGSGSAGAAAQAAEREVAPFDLLLAGAAWELWKDYETSVRRTSEEIGVWWSQHSAGRAVLVLDGLSLRELPTLLAQAEARGWTVERADVTGAEIPPDTTSFARALGFSQRSALEGGRAPSSGLVPGARTISTDMPWADCVKVVDASPDLVFWHHWPDSKVHSLAGPGAGLPALATEAKRELACDDLWALLARLATGRVLLVTSDHGYAASGLFPDVQDAEQASHLKTIFGASRVAAGDGNGESRWAPPLGLRLESVHGTNTLALGRRKWKSPGGHPTLSHGGLTLLEVFVPFVELSPPRGR